MNDASQPWAFAAVSGREVGSTGLKFISADTADDADGRCLVLTLIVLPRSSLSRDLDPQRAQERLRAPQSVLTLSEQTTASLDKTRRLRQRLLSISVGHPLCRTPNAWATYVALSWTCHLLLDIETGYFVLRQNVPSPLLY